MRQRRISLAAFVAVCVVVAPESYELALADELRVPSPRYATIQRGLDLAADGDTIIVAPGDYLLTEPLVFNRLHDPSQPGGGSVRNVSLRSEGGVDVTSIRLDAPSDSDRASVVIFEKGEGAATVLQGFTIAGGRGTARGGLAVGGGILCVDGSSPTIVDCVVQDNSAAIGAGVYCSLNAAPVLRDCVVTRNVATLRGGGVACLNSTTPRLERCAIEDNTAFEGGGVLCELFGDAELVACTLARNEASDGGGALSCTNASPRLLDCVVRENRARVGSAALVSLVSMPVLRRCTVVDNVVTPRFAAGDTAALIARGGAALTIVSSIVWGNRSAHAATESGARLEVRFSTLDSGGAWPGEGNLAADPRFCGFDSTTAHVRSQAEFEEALEFDLALAADSPCWSAGEGGEDIGAPTGRCDAPGPSARTIVLEPGRYEIERRPLDHNLSLVGAARGDVRATLLGTVEGLRTDARLEGLELTAGATHALVIDTNESPSITDCRFVGQTRGVQLMAGSRPRFERCVFESILGTAIECNGASPTVVNCVFTACAGTPLVLVGGSFLTLVNCTIAEFNGVGLLVDDLASSASVASSIIWSPGGPTAAQGRGRIEAFGSNLRRLRQPSVIDREPRHVRRAVVEFNRFTSLEVGGRLRLVPDFVVEPGDYRLQADSPSVDTGSSERHAAFDLDGNPRPCGAGPDMGAFERCDPTELEPRFVRGDCNNDGEAAGGAVSDAIFLLGFNFLGGEVPGCLRACDVDGDGRVAGSIVDAVVLLQFAFQGGIPPVPPFPDCGRPQPFDADLPCETPPEACAGGA